jgi:hypothetical protein
MTDHDLFQQPPDSRLQESVVEEETYEREGLVSLFLVMAVGVGGCPPVENPTDSANSQ